jgi:hypothetical protein
VVVNQWEYEATSFPEEDLVSEDTYHCQLLEHCNLYPHPSARHAADWALLLPLFLNSTLDYSCERRTYSCEIYNVLSKEHYCSAIIVPYLWRALLDYSKNSSSVFN